MSRSALPGERCQARTKVNFFIAFGSYSLIGSRFGSNSSPLLGMKIILGIIAAAIVGYLAWRWFAPAPAKPAVVHPPAQRSSPRPAAPTRRTPAKGVAAQQRGVKPTPARSIVVKQPRLAPEGTYFLLQRASLKTDSGVIGFAPGTKVTMIDKGDPMSTVSDGQYQFTVPSPQLTNDLDVAANAAKSDYASQVQIADSIGKSIREYEKQQRDAIAASEKEKAQKKTGKGAPPRSPSPPQHR